MNLKRYTVPVTLFLFLFSSSLAFGQDIKIADVLGTDDPAAQEEVLQQQETERESSFVNALSLVIPSQTDNPSQIVTFSDPSSEKKGVQLEIDGKGYQEVTSPYALPALGIGLHNLSFKFVDSSGATQILDKELIVLPRAPIINSPTQSNGAVIISGTGLANSELILILSSDSDIVTKESTINTDGSWSVTINENLVDGIYSFTGYTRKYGYASNLADAVTFEYGSSNIVNNGVRRENIHFSFKDINYKDIGILFSENTDLIFLILGTFFLGFILGGASTNLIRSKREEKNLIGLEKKITTKKEGSGLTIFEKLNGKADSKEDEVKEKKEEKQEEKIEEKKEERIVTKIDFLKGYKRFDPDEEGKEVKSEKKEDIKISLTSKS